jgi:hypothetical protein
MNDLSNLKARGQKEQPNDAQPIDAMLGRAACRPRIICLSMIIKNVPSLLNPHSSDSRQFLSNFSALDKLEPFPNVADGYRGSTATQMPKGLTITPSSIPLSRRLVRSMTFGCFTLLMRGSHKSMISRCNLTCPVGSV